MYDTRKHGKKGKSRGDVTQTVVRDTKHTEKEAMVKKHAEEKGGARWSEDIVEDLRKPDG